jgi:hypothetical protein
MNQVSIYQVISQNAAPRNEGLHLPLVSINFINIPKEYVSQDVKTIN